MIWLLLIPAGLIFALVMEGAKQMIREVRLYLQELNELRSQDNGIAATRLRPDRSE